MDNSAYAKMIFKNNEIIALALDKGITAFQRGMKKTVHQLSIGAERFTWYSACFFDKYQDECKELSGEDIRMLVCITDFLQARIILLI